MAVPGTVRSALYGVEVLNFAVKLLREHVKPTVRIHYAVTEGGEVANIVPDYAVALYNTRDVTLEGSEENLERVKKIATAAPMAIEISFSVVELLLGRLLGRATAPPDIKARGELSHQVGLAR